MQVYGVSPVTKLGGPILFWPCPHVVASCKRLSPISSQTCLPTALCASRAVCRRGPLFMFCPVWFSARPPVPARPHRLRRIESKSLGTLTGGFETVNSACFDSGGWRYFWWVDCKKVQREFTVFSGVLHQTWNATSERWTYSIRGGGKQHALDDLSLISFLLGEWYIQFIVNS